jgi:pheromone shutdown protein TraB
VARGSKSSKSKRQKPQKISTSRKNVVVDLSIIEEHREERAQAHRHELEKSNDKRETLSHRLALGLLAVIFITAVFLLAYGATEKAEFFAYNTLSSILGALIAYLFMQKPRSG